MTTVYQFTDGKVIFVTNKDGSVKLINVVADNHEDATSVADYIIECLKTPKENEND